MGKPHPKGLSCEDERFLEGRRRHISEEYAKLQGGSGFRVYRVFGFRVKGLGFIGFWVQGFGFRVEWFRV